MDNEEAVRRALEAATFTVQRADQELAAAREANARLTAQLVACELREKMLTDQVGLQADRIDRLEDRIAAYQDTVEKMSKSLLEAHGLRERYEELIARYRAGDR